MAAVLVGADSVVAAAVTLACGLLTALCGGRWRPLAMALACVAAIAGSCAWRLAALGSSPVRSLAEQRSTVVVDAVVRSDPRRFSRFGNDNAVVRLDVHRLTASQSAGEETLSGRFPVVAFVGDPGVDLTVGRRIRASGRLQPSQGSDSVAVLQVAQRSPTTAGAWWWSGADRVRAGVRHAVRHGPADARALIPALVDGDDGALRQPVRDEFQRTGLTHLLAVSGTNLTIVLVLALTVARAAGLGRRRLLGFGFLAVVGFVLLARPDPSVVRAAAMGSVGLVAAIFGGRGGLRTLSTAVLALLFVDPWLSRSAGFVLSVCATAGILVAAQALAARFSRWMPRWLALTFAVPLAAQWACLPALVALSGQISVVAIVANVLVAPLVAPATIAGLLGGLLDLASGGLAAIPGTLAGGIGVAILTVAHVAAGFAGAAIPWRAPWWVLVLAMPPIGYGLWRVADRPMVIVGLAIGLSLGLVRPPQVGWPPSGWLMVACDVGQGDATVLRTGSDAAVLVDTGPDPMSVDGCLSRLHVRQLPLVVITHSHADHIDGWAGAVRGRSVGHVFHGPSGGPGAQTSVGDRFRVGPVTLDVLWPPADMAKPDPNDGTAMNNSSVVMSAKTGGTTLMLTGDIETEAQASILESGVSLTSDVLKFPHHGSGRQLPEFLRAVGARITTISVGQDNDYGHPAPAALAMLRQAGIDWRRTDRDGDIAIAVGDGRLRVVTRH